MVFSQNGWTVIGSASLRPLPWITGQVRAGDVWVILDYLCRRFDAEVEPINRGWSWGYAVRAVRGSTDTSNHASGTAVDLNAPRHPLGKRGTFTTPQVVATHRILADLDNVIRWGRDYPGRADEMHFEVNAPASTVARVADRIRSGAIAVSNTTPAPTVDIPTPVAPLPVPLKRRRTMHYVVVQTDEHYLATDFNVQLVEPQFIDAVTVQWGEAKPCNAELIDRLRALVGVNAHQANVNASAYAPH